MDRFIITTQKHIIGEVNLHRENDRQSYIIVLMVTRVCWLG